MSEEALDYMDDGLDNQPEVDDYQGPSEEERNQARSQGWSEREQWKGDPDKWVDADEFLNRGRENNAILRERNDTLSRKVDSLREELKSSVRQFGEASRRAEERAYKQAMAEIKAKQESAVEMGDKEQWQQLETKKELMQQDFVSSQREPEPQYNPHTDPTFLDWHAENNWYHSNIEATAYANQVAPIIANRYPPGIMPRQFYDDIANEVKKKFPQSFRNVNRDQPAAVQGASIAGGRKSGKSYSQLPPEAKAACDKFVKQGLMTKEEYVKDYFGE